MSLAPRTWLQAKEGRLLMLACDAQDLDRRAWMGLASTIGMFCLGYTRWTLSVTCSDVKISGGCMCNSKQLPIYKACSAVF